jgi:hypothetical protein
VLRRILVGLSTVLAVTTSIITGSAGPAAAFGGETFGCRVSPGTDFEWRPICFNNRYAQIYNAGFAVLNTSGTGYTYQWTISGSYMYVITGCNSTSYDCAVAVRGGVSDKQVDVSVTYTQNGQSATRYATAYINAYCGGELC